jgi:hypothetical protein
MPSIDNFKGKVFFLLWKQDETVRKMYNAGTNGLRGRAFFTTYYFNERFDTTETVFRKFLKYKHKSYAF